MARTADSYCMWSVSRFLISKTPRYFMDTAFFVNAVVRMRSMRISSRRLIGAIEHRLRKVERVLEPNIERAAGGQRADAAGE